MIFCFKNKYKHMQVAVKCDGCGAVGYVTGALDDQTDKLLAHDWITENGWITKNEYGKWKNYCDECINYKKQLNREKYFNKEG